MPNIMTDFKKYLEYLSLEYQICEIDFMLQDFYKSNRKGENVNKKFCIINELKELKKKAILNHKNIYINNYTIRFSFFIFHLSI